MHDVSCTFAASQAHGELHSQRMLFDVSALADNLQVSLLRLDPPLCSAETSPFCCVSYQVSCSSCALAPVSGCQAYHPHQLQLLRVPRLWAANMSSICRKTTQTPLCFPYTANTSALPFLFCIATLLLSRRTYADMAGEELVAKYQTIIFLAGSASAEFFADMALSPFEAVKVCRARSPTAAAGSNFLHSWFIMNFSGWTAGETAAQLVYRLQDLHPPTTALDVRQWRLMQWLMLVMCS